MSGQHRHLAHHRRERPDRVRQPGLQWRQGQRPLLERRAAITFGATNIIAGNYLAGTHIDFGTTVPATGSGRVLAVTDYVAFDGSSTMDKLGTGEDLTGGLDIGGNLSGYVLLSSDAAYTQGVSSVVLTPGQLYNTSNVTIGGGSADALLVPATLTVFKHPRHSHRHQHLLRRDANHRRHRSTQRRRRHLPFAGSMERRPLHRLLIRLRSHRSTKSLRKIPEAFLRLPHASRTAKAPSSFLSRVTPHGYAGPHGV